MISHQEIIWFDRRIGISESHDRNAFAFFDEVGGAAVDQDFPGIGRAFEDIGFKAGSGGDRGNENFFARPEIGGVHEIARNLNAALIIHIGLCDDGAVEF